MAVRTAVLINDRDVRLGSVTLPDTVFVMSHGGSYFARTDKGIRLPGGGIAVVFQETEVYVREKLAPSP